MRANILAGTVGLRMVAGTSQFAYAAFVFRNDTSEPVVFDLQCGNVGVQTLSIAAHHSQAYRCANGAREALLQVYTEDHGADADDADLLVSDRVRDTDTYAFFRDAVGYVEVVRYR